MKSSTMNDIFLTGSSWDEFKRRYATRGVFMPEPWAEAHGYHRVVATRPIASLRGAR